MKKTKNSLSKIYFPNSKINKLRRNKKLLCSAMFFNKEGMYFEL
jgi:hypothetical protein